MPRTRFGRLPCIAGNGADVLLHCNRSGLVRREHVIHHRPSPSTAAENADSNVCNKSEVKDLRVHRVFSPSSILTNLSFSPDSKNKITTKDDLENKSEVHKQDHIDNADVLSGSGLEETSKPPSAGAAAQESSESSGNHVEQLTCPTGTSDQKRDCTTPSAGALKRDSSKVSRIQEGLRPCSKFKTVQCTSSFSYRRLLPFIMEMAKDTSSSVEIDPHQSDYSKVNNMDVKLKQSDFCIPSEKQYQSHGIENSSSPSKCLEASLYTDDKEVVLNPSDDEVNDTVTMTLQSLSNFHRRLQACEAKSEAYFHSLSEQELFCKPCDSPPTTHKDLSLEELSGGVQEFMQLPTTVDKSKSLEPKLDFDIKTKQDTSPSRMLQGRQTLSPRKSILKRNTRGCRGLCHCLDCASFRVHAKRAFQFSRKQLYDADEVVVGLIKELSHLRSIVENSNMSSTHNSQLNQEEVSSVCYRARKAEELARDHIRRMFHDLNSHCRLPGARVTFAESFEG